MRTGHLPAGCGDPARLSMTAHARMACRDFTAKPAWRSSLKGLIVLPQDGRGDLQGQDLVGPLVEPGHTRVLEMAAGPEGFEESAAAEDLHGAIGGVAG